MTKSAAEQKSLSANFKVFNSMLKQHQAEEKALADKKTLADNKATEDKIKTKFDINKAYDEKTKALDKKTEHLEEMKALLNKGK